MPWEAGCDEFYYRPDHDVFPLMGLATPRYRGPLDPCAAVLAPHVHVSAGIEELPDPLNVAVGCSLVEWRPVRHVCAVRRRAHPRARQLSRANSPMARRVDATA